MIRTVILYCLQLLLFAGAVLAAVSPAPPVEKGTLIGKVIDAVDHVPVSKVYILIDQNGAWEPTDDLGHFHFERALPIGDYSLTTYRIGYKPRALGFHIDANDTTELIIPLESQAIEFSDINISAESYQSDSPMQKPEIIIEGRTLQKQLDATIAGTLKNEPGISQRSMGPAPARPVIRGMSGDRLLVLEDGEKTGDLSATSSDHAVAIEPMTTEHIKVIRGPESLFYGSSTLGGVVNVVRGYIPRVRPHKILGESILQAASVNSGISGGMNLIVPAGPFAVRVDGSLRSAGDVRTPSGTLTNTDIQTTNGSAGVSYIHQNGFIGIAGGYYASRYGIPPDPSGGHPGGVDIDLDKQHFETRANWISPLRIFNTFEAHYTWSRYYHAEIEKNNTIGMEFGVVSHNAGMEITLISGRYFKNGKIGFRHEHRLFDTGGLTFTPAATENKTALYFYQELDLKKLRFNASLRYDMHDTVPEIVKESKVGRIRPHSFHDYSAGFGFDYRLLSGLAAGASLLRTFRAPTVSELFSEGPHLAAYSYEIGNADLHKENGIGAEFFLHYQTIRGKFRAALFRNNISNYLFPRNTGKKSLRRADLFVYQFTGMDAVIQGMELTGDYTIAEHLDAVASLSYVQGDVQDTPLPLMPPLEGKVNMNWKKEKFNTGFTVYGAAAQKRVGEFENPTKGYLALDLEAQYYFSAGHTLHVLTFCVENVLDTEYRQHLNRVKEIMPERGRNFKILHKMFF